MMKQFLIGLLFLGFCSFKPALPDTNSQYVKPAVESLQMMILTNEIIELELKSILESTKALPKPPTNKKFPPKWNVIVDDVVVMLHDKSEEQYDLAMSQYVELSSKTPFPG